MQWDGVDLARETLTYTQSKTGEKVTVPLHGELLAHLNKLAGTDKPEVFVTPALAAQRISGRRGLSESFKKIMRKAGVDSGKLKKVEGRCQLSTRTFHALRHSFTSAMANAGVSQEMRMKLTGHKTEREHQKFEQLRAAVDKLPSLG
jgi:integrase